MSARTNAAILVIDNDPIQLTGTAAVLDMAGYECWCARDREAAMKAARTQPLDLILCDVQLGKESGLDLCRDLRTIPGCDDIPVMFASNSQLPDVIRRSSEMGSAYFLRKPFDPDVLLDALQRRGLLTPGGMSGARWAEVLDEAGLVAAITCSRAGANPPRRAELATFGTTAGATAGAG